MPVYNQLNEGQLRELLIGTNGVVSSVSPFNNAALAAVNYRLFGDNPVLNLPTQYDTTGGASTLSAATSIFIEQAAGASSLTTLGGMAAVVMNASSASQFTDLGSTGDKGDVIFGSNVNGEMITVTQGANYVFGGTGANTLQGGSGADTLWGGGMSVVKGGSGDNQKLVGGLTSGAHDTLIGGSGTETLWAGYGDDSLVGGSGANTIFSGVTGNDTIIGGGKSDIWGRGANMSVSAGTSASAQDTVHGGAGFSTISTSAGHNVIYSGVGNSTITSAGSDSVTLANGGYQSFTNTGGADTVFIGATTGADTITGTDSSGVTVDISKDLGTANTYQSGSSTILAFSNGTQVTYSGTVTVHYSDQNFS